MSSEAEDEPSELIRWTAVRAARLDVVAAEGSGLSRSRAAALIKDGLVTVNGRAAKRPAEEVPVGAVVEVEVPPAVPAEALPEDLPIVIVYQDADLAVIDKAAGMVVHPAPGHATGTLVNALLFHLRDLSGVGGVSRPGIVHRLDRGTSGLLVVAKNDNAHHALAAQFADKTAGRRYLAICRAPNSQGGTVDAPLGRHPTDRLRFAVVAGGKRAVTHWRVLRRFGELALVEAVLETGRTHQVRVHLAHIGSPLLGDALYGRSVRPTASLRGIFDPDTDRPLLHATELTLVHPTAGDRRSFHAEPAADFQRILDALA